MIEALAFAPGVDAPLLYVGSHDQTIHVWDIRGPQRADPGGTHRSHVDRGLASAAPLAGVRRQR
ncbi:MAG: hypothetical protein HZY76_00185 [Anaerolineae bacterium]|nr:MAG: hypothetical protein HZY76_00185 [Anaerolineae bacterium]